MNVEYKDNDSLGPGHGHLIFSKALLPSPPWQVSLQRASDQTYLSGVLPPAWVGETVFIPLDGQATPDGDLQLNVGPSVVDGLNQQEQYRVTLKGADGTPLTARLRVRDITFTPSDSLDNTAQAVQPEPEPTPPPPPRPEPERGKPAPAPQQAPEQASSPEPAPLDLTPPPAPPKRRNSLVYLAILALLGALCVAWWYFTPPRPDDQFSRTPQQTASTSQAPASKSAEDQVREFFSRQGYTAAQAMQLAQGLGTQDAQDQDAVYRLYYYAAGQLDPAALLAYGGTVDPSTPQWGTIEKNAVEAAQAYAQAAQAHPQEAAAAREKLLAWLQDEIKKGNASARRWLEEINK